MNALLVRIFILLCLPFSAPGAEAEGTKLNILHIHADDHRADGARALGNPFLITPNLDSLAERGMTFTRCYTQGSMIGAVCTPSRTMMLTGRSWQRIPRAPAAAAGAKDPQTFLPRVMQAAGYQTMHMGKYENGFSAGLAEFETTFRDDGKDVDRAGCSQRLADKTIEYLKSRTTAPKSKPFYIYLAPPVPHDPRSAEPQFHAMYDAAKVTLSPAFMPQHPFDNGEIMVRDEMLAPWPRTEANTKQQLADYYACITGLDHHIGRIFEQLKKSGQWENTIIIFSADNGLCMGEHGLFGKQNLYEFGGMHVPLIVAGPGIAQGRSEALVYLMDLFPTFAEFGGAKLPEGIDGKSIAPILTGKQTKVRDVLYTAYRHCMRSLRDDRWKLIRYPLVDRAQLFDLSNDPHELTNLADKPEHAAKVAELTAQLQQEMAAYADPSPLTVPNPKPAEWAPPARGGKGTKPAPPQPDGRIRKDSGKHFTNWDTNQDGSLTLEEFQLGQEGKKGLEAQFKSYDKNASGKLSREEYVDPRVFPATGYIQDAEPTDGDDTVIQFSEQCIPLGLDDVTTIVAARGKLAGEVKGPTAVQGFHSPQDTVTWKVMAPAADDYAVSLIFSSPQSETMEVSCGTSRLNAESLLRSWKDRPYYWRQELPGVLHLQKGENQITFHLPNAKARTSGKRLAPLSPAKPAAQLSETFALWSIELGTPAARKSQLARAKEIRGDTSWMIAGKYGLFVHWSPNGYGLNSDKPRSEWHQKAVDMFDVKVFADAVERTGAAWMIFTLTHGKFFWPGPNEAVDKILTGRTTTRDLIGEIITELDRRGIRTLFYLHNGASGTGDPEWSKAIGATETDGKRFGDNVEAILRDSSLRYGKKLMGYGYIDCAFSNDYPLAPPWERWARAIKAGNPAAVVGFSSQRGPTVSPFSEISVTDGAGKLSQPDATLIGPGRQLGDVTPAWWCYMDGWIHRGPMNGTISKGPQNPAKKYVAYFKKMATAKIPLTINMVITADVTADHPIFNPECVAIMDEVRKAIRGK